MSTCLHTILVLVLISNFEYLLNDSFLTAQTVLLQQKIKKFLAYQRAGRSFNAEVRNRKDYRNPDFLQHAVRYKEIDQIGSCFSKDVFDPHGYDKSDFYDEIGMYSISIYCHLGLYLAV